MRRSRSPEDRINRSAAWCCINTVVIVPRQRFDDKHLGSGGDGRTWLASLIACGHGRDSHHAQGGHLMVRPPNYGHDKRRKEQERKTRQDEKRAERERRRNERHEEGPPHSDHDHHGDERQQAGDHLRLDIDRVVAIPCVAGDARDVAVP